MEELSRKIATYVSRRGYLVSSSEIARSLLEISASDVAPKVLAQNIAFGIKFFKNLRKYIPMHINHIWRSIDLLYVRSPLPAVFAKIVYHIYSKEKLKLHGFVRVWGITRTYIRKGFRELVSLEKKTLIAKLLKEAYKREIARTARVHNKITRIMEKLSVDDIFCIVSDLSEKTTRGKIETPRGIHSLFFEAPAETVFRILAILKYVSERPEILLKGKKNE